MYHALSYFACYVSTLNKSSTEWLWMYSFKSYYCKSKMSAKISDMIKNKALLSHYVLLKIIRYKFLDLSLSNESARLLFCSLKALHAFWFFIDHMVLSMVVFLHIILTTTINFVFGLDVYFGVYTWTLYWKRTDTIRDLRSPG